MDKETGRGSEPLPFENWEEIPVNEKTEREDYISNTPRPTEPDTNIVPFSFFEEVPTKGEKSNIEVSTEKPFFIELAPNTELLDKLACIEDLLKVKSSKYCHRWEIFKALAHHEENFGSIVFLRTFGTYIDRLYIEVRQESEENRDQILHIIGNLVNEIVKQVVESNNFWTEFERSWRHDNKLFTKCRLKKELQSQFRFKRPPDLRNMIFKDRIHFSQRQRTYYTYGVNGEEIILDSKYVSDLSFLTEFELLILQRFNTVLHQLILDSDDEIFSGISNVMEQLEINSNILNVDSGLLLNYLLTKNPKVRKGLNSTQFYNMIRAKKQFSSKVDLIAFIVSFDTEIAKGIQSEVFRPFFTTNENVTRPLTAMLGVFVENALHTMNNYGSNPNTEFQKYLSHFDIFRTLLNKELGYGRLRNGRGNTTEKFLKERLYLNDSHFINATEEIAKLLAYLIFKNFTQKFFKLSEYEDYQMLSIVEMQLENAPEWSDLESLGYNLSHYKELSHGLRELTKLPADALLNSFPKKVITSLISNSNPSEFDKEITIEKKFAYTLDNLKKSLINEHFDQLLRIAITFANLVRIYETNPFKYLNEQVIRGPEIHIVGRIDFIPSNIKYFLDGIRVSNDLPISIPNGVIPTIRDLFRDIPDGKKRRLAIIEVKNSGSVRRLSPPKKPYVRHLDIAERYFRSLLNLVEHNDGSMKVELTSFIFIYVFPTCIKIYELDPFEELRLHNGRALSQTEFRKALKKSVKVVASKKLY